MFNNFDESNHLVYTLFCQLYEEIVSVCDTEEITVEQISQLKYLEYCINESMRLYPQGFR